MAPTAIQRHNDALAQAAADLTGTNITLKMIFYLFGRGLGKSAHLNSLSVTFVVLARWTVR
jgi:hypothetical protein